MLAKYGLLLQKIKRAETILAVLMFAFIVSIIAAQIMVRYFLGKPLTWAEELAALLLIYLTFLTADIVYKERAHISINYFVNKMPPKARSAVALAIHLLIIVFLVNLIEPCITLFKMQYGHISTAVVTVPKSYWSLPVPLSFGSMILTTGYFIIEEINKLRQT